MAKMKRSKIVATITGLKQTIKTAFATEARPRTSLGEVTCASKIAHGPLY